MDMVARLELQAEYSPHRDRKIREIVMAKVIEFYVPMELPETVQVGSSAAMRKGHRVLSADKEISLVQPWRYLEL
jgi:hypothetical protein